MHSAIARFQAWPTGITARIYEECSAAWSYAARTSIAMVSTGFPNQWPDFKIGLIGSRPGRDQAHVDLRIRGVDQLREPRRIVDDLAGIARRVCIERAVALQDYVIPAACDERRLLLKVKIQVHAGGRFETDVIRKSSLAGEGLEQCRHTAHAIAIEVRHGPGR